MWPSSSHLRNSKQLRGRTSTPTPQHPHRTLARRYRISVLDPRLTRTARAVGVPVAERVLTSDLYDLAPRLFAPGSGRSLIRLREVEIGTGRPDAIFLVISSAALEARRRADMRLPSIAHARVLESMRTGCPSGYCQRHVKKLVKSLWDLGWLTRRGRVRALQRTIARSLLVEAKISDWRRGILQLTRARWAGHQAALLMPLETHHRVSSVALDHNRLGLIVRNQCHLDWRITSPTLQLGWMADMWLTELALREIDAERV